MNFTQSLLMQIADFLISGMYCYVHKKTATVLPFPTYMSNEVYTEEEPWIEVKQIVLNDEANYVQFAPMNNDEFMDIVNSFFKQEELLAVKKVTGQLINNTYNVSLMFQIIYNSHKYKQKWLYFKQVEYIKWVRNKLLSIE